MTAEAQPYTAISRFLERTPSDLTSPGKEIEYFPELTALVRGVTSLAMHELILSQDDVDRYHGAGVAVVVPSHRSFLDLTVVSTLGQRSGEGQPFFMSKRENMDNRATAWLYGHMRTFPIDRDMTDPRWARAFFKWGKFVLGTDIPSGEQNSKLVIFPEGTRKDGDVIFDIESGASTIAHKAGRPLLPVGIYAKRTGLNIRPTVSVAVGEPFTAGRKGNDLVTERMQEQYDRAMGLWRSHCAARRS